MSTKVEAENPRLEALHKRLAENSMAGHWQAPQTRRPELKPWVWPWSVIHSCLMEAGEVVPIGKQGEPNARRTVNLVNPTLVGNKATSRSLQMSVQLVKPGEVATAHRHTASALRFVVESEGMYTVADGEQMIMEPGDLLIQPNWAWHDHKNITNTNAVWLDVLDGHLIGHLDSSFGEPYGEGDSQPITKPDGWSRSSLGVVRPRTSAVGNQAMAFVYKWTDTLQALEGMAAAGESDPHDGVLLEYTNPVTGGPTMPIIGCWIQMLRPGEETRPHRHTGMTIYHAVRGQGVTTVGKGETEDLEWGDRDCFMVPGWQWHRHRNLSKSEPAIIFSVTDRPAIEVLGLYREEKG